MQETLFGRIRMEICAEQFRIGTDSMVLADFCRIRPGSRVADLGCGCGTLGLLLLSTDPSLYVTGVELQEDAASQARRNAEANGFSEHMTVICGDLRAPGVLPASFFDDAVCNPPYYPADSGPTPKRDSDTIARTEVACALPDLAQAAARALRWGGRLFLVHRPERLADLMWALRQARLEPKRIRFVRHHPGAPVNLVLLESRLGGRAGLSFDETLVLYEPDGTPSADCRRIYHMTGE